MEKNADRRKYNPDGNNTYTSPQQKPPRHDLRNKHKVLDPLEKQDKLREEKIAEEEIMEKENIKRVARKLMAAKKNDKETEQTREGIEGFKFQDTGIKAVAQTYKCLANSFMHLVKASNMFSACKSSQISPDGKLGGKGYIQSIRDIRESFSTAINILSELIDTFHDEVNSPYWKKTTLEDNPIVKEILSEADSIIDKTEVIEEKQSSNPQLSDEEKEKVKAILKSKKW